MMMHQARNMWMMSSRSQLVKMGARTFSSSVAVKAKALQYTKHGSPLNVLKLEDGPVGGKGDVKVKMIAAPINPADINLVQGIYGEQVSLPAVGGNEGVAEIVEAGSSSFKVGDRVIPKKIGFGTWATERLCSADDLLPFPYSIPDEYAATLSVNPCTAYRLINDFESLKEGDVIIQNGANSMVGQSVFQIANKKGIKTINIVRSRDEEEYGELVERMKSRGADIVVPCSMVGTPHFKKLLTDLPAPKLAFNCVGGQSATDLARQLAPGGTLVTYGGMSRKPVQIPTSLLIFNDIKLRGFWLTRWIEENTESERTKMLDELAGMVVNKELRLWIETYGFTAENETALQRAVNDQKDRKIVYKF